MPSEGALQEAGFSNTYTKLRQEFADQLGERNAAYGQAGRSVREEIVRCVWFGSHFPAEGLATDDGRRIEIASPGWWNVEGGPDFVRAEFVLEGEGRVVGDVEVHTLASGWRSHGHHRQPEYNDVALHVVMWNDRGEQYVRTQDGKSVPQLTLTEVVEEDLEELVEAVGPEDEQPSEGWGAVEGRYCGDAYRNGDLDPEWVGRLLDAAGEHRLLTRAAALAELFGNHSREQLLYERLAEALGYKNNRMPFMQLAGLLPTRLLRQVIPTDAPLEERSRRLEAAYFVVGGFVQSTDEEQYDPETARYREELRRAWRELGEPPTGARLSPDHWQFGGTRPVNYPARRIAALARLCARHVHGGLFSHFLKLVASVEPEGGRRFDVVLRDALLDAFTRLEHPYWSHHYTFGGTKLSTPKALVGRGRATDILVNVLLPMLLAHARVEDATRTAQRLRAVWQGLPRRPDNTVTRRMGQVMFGDEAAARKVVNSVPRQQGLHQLYRDCCRPGTGCEQCIVYLAHRSGRRLAAS